MTLESKIKEIRNLIRDLEKRRKKLSYIEVEQLEFARRILKTVEKYLDRKEKYFSERLEEIRKAEEEW